MGAGASLQYVVTSLQAQEYVLKNQNQNEAEEERRELIFDIGEALKKASADGSLKDIALRASPQDEEHNTDRSEACEGYVGGYVKASLAIDPRSIEKMMGG